MYSDTMYRRLFLLATLPVLTGCMNQNQNSSQQYRDAFETHLDEIGVNIQSIDQSEEQLQIAYVPSGSQYQELSAEIGGISGGFLREVENGWAITRLDADIVSAADQLIARWFVKSAWIDEYRNDEITAEELSLRVIETLEFVEET